MAKHMFSLGTDNLPLNLKTMFVCFYQSDNNKNK